MNQGGNAQGAHRSILELVQAAERGEELSDFERQQIAISILLNSQEVRDYNDSLNGLQLDLYTRAGIAGALPKPKGGGDNSPTDWAAIARAAAEAGSVLPGIGLPADLALLGDAFVNGDNLDVGLAVFGFLPFGDLAKPFKGRLKLLFKGADPDAVNVSKLDDYYGVEKGWADGATPNSKYTQVHPENNKAIQSTIYDENGKAIGHVDWKEQHGIGSGHGHEFEIPGDFSSGHQGKGKLHLPEALPEGWVDLPPGIDPIQPIK